MLRTTHLRVLLPVLVALMLPPSARAGTFLEPDATWCKCAVSGDPVVQTGDNAILLIIKQQKSLISQWDNPDDAEDKCQFTLRAVTQEEIGSETGSIYVEWIGFGFDNLPDNDKRKRNVLIGQNLTYVLERGHSFDRGELRELPYSYYSPDMDLEVFTEGDGAIKLRSSTCGYAIDFFPDGRDTSFHLYVNQHFMTNSMTGMCGNCNGDHSDDFRTCPRPGTPSEIIHTEDKFFVISDSCADGKHQGWNYMGGMKIKNYRTDKERK